MSFKFFTILIMAFFYIYIGIRHFIEPQWFMQIMPPFIPYHLELVYISGFFEILFGTMLLFSRTRALACFLIILLLVAVYPANLYLAFNKAPQEALGISSFAASWIRLPIQFIFIGLAYWHSKNTSRTLF